MPRRLVPTVLLALACLLALGAAAPNAGALTRDSQTRQNLRLLKVYIDAYAGEHSFAFPAAAIVKKGGGLGAPVWPVNPWTGRTMAPGTGRGAYSYAPAAGGAAYTLSGRLSSGAYTVTGEAPAWLADERSAATSEISTLADQLADAQADLATARQQAADALAAVAPTRKQAAELGARLIRSYVEQWGMLNNASAPSADKVSKTGAVGAAFPYWPDDPYTGAPMTAGGQQGGYLYSPGSGGAYSMSATTGAATTVTLDGAVPQQLTNALTAARDDYVKTSMYYLQGAIDRYAWDYNDVYPAPALVTQIGLSDYAFDYWPANPWLAATAMGPGTGKGTYTYVLGGSHGYTLAGRLGDGTDFTVDGYWAERKMGFRDRMKNMTLQAHGQVLRDYIEEWKAAHTGVPPTLEQMTRTGAVGASHGWWPLSPWTNSPMVNNDTRGEFQYAVGADASYTLTVRQAPITPYSEYYTPE